MKHTTPHLTNMGGGIPIDRFPPSRRAWKGSAMASTIMVVLAMEILANLEPEVVLLT